MLETAELPAHVAAEKYMISGESFLSRLLPYWGVRLAWQAQLVLLPLLAVLIPLWRLYPAVNAFRVDRILRRKYAALRDAVTKGVERRVDELAEAHVSRGRSFCHSCISAIDSRGMASQVGRFLAS